MTLICLEGKSNHLPCRLQAVAEGVEWFIYNRTPAYDDILRHMQPDLPEARPCHPETSESAPFLNEAETGARPNDHVGSTCFVRLRQLNNNNSLPMFFCNSESDAKVRKAKRRLLSPVTLLKHLAEWMYQQLPSPDLKDILPIGFEVTRGAITLGNDSTPNILIGNFKRATGTFGLQPVSLRMVSMTFTPARRSHCCCSLGQSLTHTSKFII